MIKNGSDTKIGDTNFNLPNMSSPLESWLQNLIFGVVTTEIVNYKAVEIKKDISFKGVWQPMSSTRVSQKPEREREFDWYLCHSKIDLQLKNNDIIKYRDRNFRIMSKGHYDDYGYFNYELVEVFTGVGPYEEEEDA